MAPEVGKNRSSAAAPLSSPAAPLSIFIRPTPGPPARYTGSMNTKHIKHADTNHPIHDHLAARYSPYVFAPQPVEQDKLHACLEALRWAPSSYNEQPWSYILAERTNEVEFATMLGCLNEANQTWAAQAGVLLISVVKHTFERNGKPNRVAEHDLGLAAANLTFQAHHLGLAVHQMAGIELAKCRATYSIPEGYDPFTAIAIGYAGTAEHAADEAHAERDQNPRARKPLNEIIFRGSWGESGV